MACSTPSTAGVDIVDLVVGGAIAGAACGMRAHEFVLDAMHAVLVDVLAGQPKLLESLLWTSRSMRSAPARGGGEQVLV